MKIEDFISMESNRPNHLMLSVLTCICCEDIFSWYCAAKWTQHTVNSQQGDVNQQLVLCSAPSVSQSVFTITEKAPTPTVSEGVKL